METLYVPTENDVKKWVREAVQEGMALMLNSMHPAAGEEEPLLGRKQIAKLLNISLVTLTDWAKHGLPVHKNRGRAYYLRSEVIEYIKANEMGEYRQSRQFLVAK